MARVRRPRYLAFFCDDFPFLDVEQALRGEVQPVSLRQLCAFSILTGETVELTADELDLVLSIPSDAWVEAPDETVALELGRKGVVLVDSDELQELRERDETLVELNWNLESALYYFLTKWRGVDLRHLTGRDETSDLLPPAPEDVVAFVDEFGPPPPAFHSVTEPEAVVDLPLAERSGELYDVLLRRRTVRNFDAVPLGIEKLATVLRYIFGYHAYAPLLGEVTTLKRTSPSAGGFHPVEAYLLLNRVEELPSGLYHYSGRRHALERIESLLPAEARELAAFFVCGQSYFADAHALVLLAARFDRAFWKYRNHQKALAALLMDAAHLSQTLYLVCTELGLGAFVTAAVNNVDIEERLGLDGVAEGVLAVCGFGNPAAEPSPFDPPFVPLAPDRS
jgi:putative peptide maturation dehydrogenase